ncbi:hypothetical protein J5N97_017994 [Dioscorea zingiberensis]|uniref:Uncharacterized protein n=1 Tax=Dioscorea zingiberensis TaxID=325984 RepID=A0A9D5CNG9_9LILI|nr:hypothetical protein J5N97_017994 [Dioscorea zingiberensis]
MAEDKKMKVKKGCLAVRVGLENEEGSFKRFMIPISYLHHPLFKELLEKAQDIYGFNSFGPLKLPCSADEFLHLRWQIERESPRCHSPNSSHNHHSFSFHSC